MKEKKAAMELSLNLIIMLIIGIVVLGLVIGFVNNLVNQGKSTYETQLSDNEKLKLDEVSRCSDNLCIIPDPSLTVKLGEPENVFIKVRAFSGDIVCRPGPLTACGAFSYAVVDSAGSPLATGFNLAGPGFTATQGNSDAKMYTLDVAKTTTIGTYYMTLTMYPSDATKKVTKTITINVE